MTRMLKIIKGKIIISFFLINTIIPFTIKNIRMYQARTSVMTNNWLSFVNCHGKGPKKTLLKEIEEFLTKVIGFSNPVFTTTEEDLPRDKEASDSG